MNKFLWLPGDGVDSGALNRLRTHLRRPASAMGEAWFMSTERRMFRELLGDLDELAPLEIRRPLDEIIGGMSSFGRRKEWEEWFNYLLAQLIPRSHENFVDYLLEYLVSGLIAVYPSGKEVAPYEGFMEDVLHTLGKAIMDPACWDGSNIRIGTVLRPSDDCPAKVWFWWDASGDFSASMFLCLKYLPPAAIAEWAQSVLRIASPHWRAQLIVWLVGAHDCLTTGCWPAELKEGTRPAVSWASSHCLHSGLLGEQAERAPFLARESRDAFMRTVARTITEDLYLEWLSSMAPFPYLEAELAEIPSTFEALYLRGSRT